MLIKNIILILFIFSSYSLFAQKVSHAEIMQVANDFLSDSKQIELINIDPEIKLITSEKTEKPLFYILNYENAFIIVSADKKHPPIKAFSFKNKFKINKKDVEQNMLNILIFDYENFNVFLFHNKDAILINQNKWQEKLKNIKHKDINNEVFGPYLPSIYGQKWYYENGNNIYTTQYYTPNHNPVGCVALTFTELMQYYNWPRKGVGSYSYSDNTGNTTGTFQANFEEKYYNWSLVLDEYKGVETTDAQRSQLGKIAYHAAVSLDMEFESSGSTSNVNRIPNAAKTHFRYIADYKEKNASGFWQALDASLQNGIPAQFAIYTSSGGGHAVVGDGIKYVGDEKYYHLNMGWWGTTNGWYKIHQSFNAGGYTNVTAAVLNMIPVPELDEKPKIDFENKTATLKWYYPERNPAQNFELQIKNGAADWETLTDTFTTSFSYVFQVDDKTNYSFRIKAKVHDSWYDNSWSNIINVKQTDFKLKGDKKLALYPSVATNEIKVSYTNLTGSTIKIFDLSGNIVYQNKEEIMLNEYKIQISSLETGIYILQIINETEKKTIKFIKL